MKKVLVVAPHPDDETLGCGGTLLKHHDKGDEIHWLIVTHMFEEQGFSKFKIKKRDQEVKNVANLYRFHSTHKLKYPTSELEIIKLGKLIGGISEVVKKVQPEIIYVPYPGDVHTDHEIVFNATIACTKSFRYPFVKKVLAYETLSETDFGINPDHNGFRPNLFVDISKYLDKKIEIMKVFESEIGDFPFPRSEKAIRSLAAVRGAACGAQAAESFMILREIW